ncbi:MAG TPA: FHA domain-containing protein [Nitriliruptorales bacterium]|nr:FHA domain-containing protein [Nitriliruptorales bacterium]
MFCSHCGSKLAEGANFCAQCGTPVTRSAADAGEVDRTTAAIDVGALDPTSTLEHVPALEPGTGMLVVMRGPNAGARFLLDRDHTTVGRHPDCEIFLHDVTVSRRHSEVVRREGRDFVLRDLGSLNGSYVNGDRVEERTLRSGDEVQIGRFKLLYLGGDHRGGGV